MSPLPLPQLFDIVPDALVLVDAQGRIARVNANAERLFGYPHGAMVGMDVEGLMPEGMRGRHLQHRDRYMASPRVRPMGQSDQSLIGQRADGQQFPVEIALSPIETEIGRHYLASVRDISESHRARQALVRARYDALIAHLGQMALNSSSEQQVVPALPGLLAEELEVDVVVLALSERDETRVELKTSTDVDAPLLESSVHASWPALVGSLISDRACILSQTQLRLLEATSFASGAAVPLLDRSRAMGVLLALSSSPRQFHHDALHLLQSAAIVVASMMQRRYTEEQLAHAQRIDAIGQMTGGVAHDFNNLLTIVSGTLQLLEDEYGDRPEALELIDEALRSVKRGADLTSKLLAFARRQALAPRAVSPEPLVHDLGIILQRTLGEACCLTIECPAAIPRAYVDPTLLETALINLVLNARDAMPLGGDIALSVTECWVRPDEAADLGPGHYIVMQVRDHGTGMSAEVARRAIEPFFTTKAAGRGSGLGLSMAYGFARQSNGSLRVDSEPGRGTTMSLYLPVARSAPSADAAGASSAGGRGETVLVVEDDPGVRRIAVAFLTSAGYRALEAPDAETALDVVGAVGEISVLFSDIMLGSGMSGHTLANLLQARYPRLGVLLTTGYDDTSESASSLATSYALIRKPYQREQLAAAVRRIAR
ncbi:PAS domain S-box protein [Lysobacter soli]|uniref:PAS domain S-box protein n=1 Tax=Lysobacter soli TaxID=453783 RepID=UPI00240FF5AC|nr:PAS domain S-box protein [Lysobacter soli]MDG2518390.1 PAS domain S-box protein [Lysobacter soli]